MEKRGQIPTAQKPNAAAKADVERIRQRVSDLGTEWNEAVKAAGLGYATGYRFLKGEASVASLRTLEEWVVKEELRRKKTPAPSPAEQDARLAEWLDLGRELMASDPRRFDVTLDGLRDVLQSVKLQQSAFRKMFRATPDDER